MKNLIFITGLALSMLVPVYAASGETTKVCVDIKDKEGKPIKDAKGNVKQQCKEMKVHKKLEGTEIPPKK
jgi:hypothetical protein